MDVIGDLNKEISAQIGENREKKIKTVIIDKYFKDTVKSYGEI